MSENFTDTNKEMMDSLELTKNLSNNVNVLDPRIARMKEKLLTSPYEICMARARYFTEVYKENEGLNPNLRDALALQRTLQKQKIFIYADEYLAGSKTEKFLAPPLSIDRGDFLRSLQFEMNILHLKQNPFLISKEDKKLFKKVIYPYWNGKTLRDYKANEWEKSGLIKTKKNIFKKFLELFAATPLLMYNGFKNTQKLMGAKTKSIGLLFKALSDLYKNRYELARNNPTAAIFCFDVQGHLSLGIDKVVEKGMGAIIKETEDRLKQLEEEEPENENSKNFLKSVIISLEAAIQYSERFAILAEEMATNTDDENEKKRFEMIATHCHHVPRNKPRTFHEAIQTAYFSLLVGEIQYGNHEVFAVGRTDQYLYPYFQQDIETGVLTEKEAIALLQEFYLKLSANVEPIPEAGMETNGTLGNNQHCVTIGGLTPNGEDATNRLSTLMLDAHEQMKGAINQLSVRFHENSPGEFVRRTAEVFRTTNGIAIYNDDVIINALVTDGLNIEDAKDYCIVGCIETSGQSDTHGCPGGHEIVLPVVLSHTLTRGKLPPTSPGQKKGFDSGDAKKLNTFDKFISAFRNQLNQQVKTLVEATAGKDIVYRDIHPAPYVSALMDDCIKKAKDITNGGSRYDFTSIDVRGLATLVDSLMAIKYLVYNKHELTLSKFIKILKKNFKKQEVLRQRIIHEVPKYGVGNQEADDMALQVLNWLYEEASKYKNIRGGQFRMCYYSYGNHVLDGLMLGATPDGRHRGDPISNGVSPSNLFQPNEGPTGPMKTVAKFPPNQISSGVSLNMRFHPNFIKTDNGLDTFSSLIRTYFKEGGMHLQPNVISTEILRDAQQNPDQYRDLVVKVSGYSAYFTDLGKSIQEDIIARNEFGI